jgi:hypothetical protein
MGTDGWHPRIREKSVEDTLFFLWGVLLYNFSTSEEAHVQHHPPIHREALRRKIAKYEQWYKYVDEALKSLKMENDQGKVKV